MNTIANSILLLLVVGLVYLIIRVVMNDLKKKSGELLSNCCGAKPDGELDFDEDGVKGTCSRCKDGALFEETEKE